MYAIRSLLLNFLSTSSEVTSTLSAKLSALEAAENSSTKSVSLLGIGPAAASEAATTSSTKSVSLLGSGPAVALPEPEAIASKRFLAFTSTRSLKLLVKSFLVPFFLQGFYILL